MDCNAVYHEPLDWNPSRKVAILVSMTNVTRLLASIDQGDPSAADDLLPLVYSELRQLAAARLRHEQPGQTLQATALVHEAYLRLVGGESEQSWDSRGHFFAAAAESMRRILVERARRRKAEKHGGQMARVELSAHDLLSRSDPEEILALSDALDVLARAEAEAAELVKLRIFADFSVEEAGKLLGMSRATAYRHWTYARAWLKTQLANDLSPSEDGKKSEKT
jgi:RNA polymerase sigma factor (TIGR02999 family)